MFTNRFGQGVLFKIMAIWARWFEETLFEVGSKRNQKEIICGSANFDKYQFCQGQVFVVSSGNLALFWLGARNARLPGVSQKYRASLKYHQNRPNGNWPHDTD